jgi:hypothetical protein
MAALGTKGIVLEEYCQDIDCNIMVVSGRKGIDLRK